MLMNVHRHRRGCKPVVLHTRKQLSVPGSYLQQREAHLRTGAEVSQTGGLIALLWANRWVTTYP